MPLLDCAAVTERITRADVEHVAHLARLALSDDEVATYTEQLAGILDHARDLEELDLAGVEPTGHPFPLRNVLRADDARPGVDRSEVLAQAPASEAGRFRVPRILDA